MNSRKLSRRKFLKDSTAAAIAGALYLGSPVKSHSQVSARSRVVLIRHRDVLDKLNRPVESLVENMLDEAVTVLCNEKNPDAAWRKIIFPEDVVGIKSNIWRYLATPAELENAIRKRVLKAGVREEKVSISDRGILREPNFVNSTALINVRPMRTHHWSGVGTLLKNYIMFVKYPSSYHPDVCADLASIWKLPHVNGKTRLNILVLFTPLFHSVGPHNYNPQYIWRYNGLLVGFDPVAVDATGVQILLAKRQEYFGEDRPINPPPKHIFLADTRHHLGNADPAKIELIKLGWKEDVLI